MDKAVLRWHSSTGRLTVEGRGSRRFSGRSSFPLRGNPWLYNYRNIGQERLTYTVKQVLSKYMDVLEVQIDFDNVEKARNEASRQKGDYETHRER